MRVQGERQRGVLGSQDQRKEQGRDQGRDQAAASAQPLPAWR